MTLPFSAPWDESAFSQSLGSGLIWFSEPDALSLSHGPKAFSSSWILLKTSRPMPQTDSWSSLPPPHVGRHPSPHHHHPHPHPNNPPTPTHPTHNRNHPQITRFMGPTWPPCWPHEPWYQGQHWSHATCYDESRVSLYHSTFHLFLGCNAPLASFQQHAEKIGDSHYSCRGWLWAMDSK